MNHWRRHRGAVRINRLRLVAMLLIALFSSSAVRWPNAVPRSCAGRCPADCPMHAAKKKCHEASGATCHKAKSKGPGLHAAGCAQRDAVSANSGEPTLPSAALLAMVPQVNRIVVSGTHLPRHIALDPPFRPPPVSWVPVV